MFFFHTHARSRATFFPYLVVVARIFGITLNSEQEIKQASELAERWIVQWFDVDVANKYLLNA